MRNFCVDCKNAIKFPENVLLFEILGFELVARISLIYDENVCDQKSACYQTVNRFEI